MTKIGCSPEIRSRFVKDVNGLTIHVLEAGFEAQDRPCVLLLHGFPELAYSWRKVMLPLAAAGYHVVAPDQRGYGQTTGWDGDYDGDVGSFRLLNVVEVFQAVALMSAPFVGPPPLPFDTADLAPEATAGDAPGSRIHRDLAALNPPRKHYQWYYSSREADDNMRHCPQGIHGFLRAYFHVKSADWKRNEPFPLESWSAEELAKLPTYYIMEADKGMAETVAPEMPSASAIAACMWLPDEELRVYSEAFARTGFQGGLQWYRCMTSGWSTLELQLFSGRTIDVPSCFIAGRSDWGVYQKPGDFERMQECACTRMLGCHLVSGAGHWVQQEQPARVTELLLEFLTSAGRA
jgi:pimeloyl-ACP methyl ester carboxylesterase